MFETVGRYRDPEAHIRRAVAGCLTGLLTLSAIAGTLAVWLLIWLWPHLVRLFHLLLALLLELLLGRDAADAWLPAPEIVAVPVEVGAIEAELAEPYLPEDPPLEPAPLPGAEPPAELALAERLDEADDGVAIAHLRGWNDDADFAAREALLTEEVAEVGMLAILGGAGTDEGGALSAVFSSDLSDAEGLGGMIGAGEYEGGGLGLSGIRGGGDAEGFGGLGAIGTGRAREKRDRKRDREADELVRLLGDMEGVGGGVVGGVTGGVVGGVAGGAYEIDGPSSSDPVLVGRAEPEYPEAARAAGIAGECTATVRVKTTGRGELVSFGACPNPLRAAVVEAIGRSRWAPAVRDGASVEATVTMRYVFTDG